MSTETNRLIHLDVIRAFSLLGILLVNFQWFYLPLQASALGIQADISGLNRVVEILISLVAEGKFYPLFALLFGIGFALMQAKSDRQQKHFWRQYGRRVLLLGLLGCLHMLFIWAGDILVLYAITAASMFLLFNRTPTQRLWKWAVLFLCLPTLLYFISASFVFLQRFNAEQYALFLSSVADYEAFLIDYLAQASLIHTQGSWFDNVKQRVDDVYFQLQSLPFWLPHFLGLFLLGRWLINSHRITHLNTHHTFFMQWRIKGLILGVPLTIAGYFLIWDEHSLAPDFKLALGTTLFQAGALLMALSYLCWLTLHHDRLRWIAPAGQMALSNYLLQSLLWTWILNGYGFGWGNHLPRWSHPLWVLVFFALQILFSRWWLKRYYYGPVEWLWRSITYWQKMPMQRQNLRNDFTSQR